MADPRPESPRPLLRERPELSWATAGRGSHRKHRAALKKERRKARRQELARLRDAGLEQQARETVSEACLPGGEQRLETERQQLHEEWLRREQKAQEEFQRKREKEEATRRRQEALERTLNEEREEQLRKEREEEELKLREKRALEAAVQKMLDQAESELENGAAWQNPEPPSDGRVMEKHRASCPFYRKTGACRFGDRCSRKHTLPASSPTLLVRSMFTTFGMDQCRMDDYDPDASLEYSEEETYQQFLEFYEDVLPEFKNVGKVVQFKVSCNFEPHLRGNVYVQYQSKEDCRAALARFNGRWYGGRQLRCEFCPVTQWQMAICGLFETQKCSRGKHCNFLHVFRNPNNEFWEADRDMFLSLDGTSSSSWKSSDRRERLGHRDSYYSRSRGRRSPSSDHSYHGNRESERKRSRDRGKKSHKRASKSRDKHSFRSRGRKRDCSRSPESRSHRGRRPGSRDKNTQSPKAK
ncbi:U2 small nuclear ribonucleoprotein auxiliary factor 35 kDa subunit-related protein 2-like [Tenrec ecaudatus]|uniref:U2 small nuclear ribonucleoprotein auxiliary factor 35 kDa subunit-related protein 2-like n=1 Tax=Tenrec ecaudatus TaxID=94439 RepID=UPI003F5983E7